MRLFAALRIGEFEFDLDLANGDKLSIPLPTGCVSDLLAPSGRTSLLNRGRLAEFSSASTTFVASGLRPFGQLHFDFILGHGILDDIVQIFIKTLQSVGGVVEAMFSGPTTSAVSLKSDPSPKLSFLTGVDDRPAHVGF